MYFIMYYILIVNGISDLILQNIVKIHIINTSKSWYTNKFYTKLRVKLLMRINLLIALNPYHCHSVSPGLCSLPPDVCTASCANIGPRPLQCLQ